MRYVLWCQPKNGLENGCRYGDRYGQGAKIFDTKEAVDSVYRIQTQSILDWTYEVRPHVEGK